MIYLQKAVILSQLLRCPVVSMSIVKLDYNIDWSEYFKLDVESPSGLTRIKGKRGNKIKPNKIIKLDSSIILKLYIAFLQ